MSDNGRQRILFETHTHTPFCKHALGDPEAYAAVAWQRGLCGLAVTCHNPMPRPYSPSVRMDPDQLPCYVDLVGRARDIWRGRIDVRLGLECDYFPGYEGFLEQQLRLYEFEYVLGSIHPHTEAYYQRYWKGDVVEYFRTYFALLADAAETGLFDCLSHPDIIKNELPSEWSVDLVRDDVRRALDRIAACGVALELNTSGADKLVPEMNPFPAMLVEMHCRGIPVVVGSDAHQPQRVGERFDEALALLAQCGFRQVSHFLKRQRHDVSITSARRTLRQAVPGESRT
jgi:histidinol-phosphatase (PHP family)